MIAFREGFPKNLCEECHGMLPIHNVTRPSRSGFVIKGPRMVTRPSRSGFVKKEPKMVTRPSRSGFSKKEPKKKGLKRPKRHKGPKNKNIL